MTQQILTRSESGVFTVTINRLERKNSLTAEMYTALADALAVAAHDPLVRSVILQGHETVFCAGNDLGEFLNSPPTGENSPVSRYLHAIAVFPKPLIAAVCGPAVGVGTTMLLHCDLVYAGENAIFSVPFVSLGLCPEAGSSLLLQQRLGYHRAAEMLLLGNSLGAEEALRMGLVNKVLAPGETNAFARAQGQRLSALPLTSLIETKRLMKKTLEATVARQMKDEQQSFQNMLASPAAKEAFAAFLAKRKPDFSQY